MGHDQRSLIDLFSDKRHVLKKQLESETSVESVVKALQNFIGLLFVELRQTEKDDQRVRLMQGLADCLTKATELILSVNEPTIWTVKSVASRPVPRISSIVHLLPLIPALRLLSTAVLSLLLFILADLALEKILILVFLITIVVFHVIEIVPMIRYPKAYQVIQNAIKSNTSDHIRATLSVETEIMLRKLRDTFLQADRLLEQAEPAHYSNLECLVPDTIIDYLQDIASAHLTGDRDYLDLLSAKVVDLLLPFGIMADMNSDGVNQSHFDAAPSLDMPQAKSIVSRPVFVSESSGVLRRGEIRVPMNKLDGVRNGKG